MAVRSLGQLTLDLVAKVGGFTGPMDKASRQAKKSMTSIASSVKSASQAMATAGTAASAAAAGFLVYAKSAADSARETKNQAAVANTSVEAFQRMAYASTTVGVEQDKLSQILQDVNDRVGDFMATGGGEMADFFENIAPQVGVTAEQFRNLSGPQALQLYYDSLEKANLSQQDMTFYLEAVASDTTALIPLLRDGGKGFAEMGDEADRLGIVLSELDIAKLNQFSTEFDKSLKLLSSMGQILVTELTPYMTALGDELVDAAADTDDLRDSFAVAFRQAVESIGPVLDKIHDLRIAGAEVMVWVGELDVAFANFAQNAWGHVDALIDSIIEGINKAITGLQSLPGFGDLELIDYDFGRSSFMGRIVEQTYEAREQLSKYNLELSELVNAGAPSAVISDYLDKVDEQAKQLEEALSGVTEPAAGSTLPNAKDREAAQKAQAAAAKEAAQAAKEAAREAERLADAQQSVIDRLYPAQAAWRQYHEDMRLLELRSASDATLDLADAQRQLNNELSVGLTGGFMEQVATGGLADELENTNDIAKDLGLTFSSAFEDAIVGGEGFRDVLAGITEDIARLAVRKSITEPAANWLGTAFSVGLSAFGGGSPVQGGFTSAINTGASFVGQAHDGIDRVPQEGTWNLAKGERVITSPQADKLDRFLASQQFTPVATAVTVNAPVHVTAEGGATMQDGERQGRAAAQVIKATVLQVIQEQKRQGGLLAKR
ncbi:MULTISPECIES: hypothetical protein [Halomonas]|uniref:hypothetical protein n=1 Tax=Halomonas TaxID=2745 RepID=UPI0015E65318|nr:MULTISPECIES: hypothetical protein [Halomonas]